ncbi:uncharacterized protein N7511_004584 [Penicillium nucicola]|uniref:uncharacterized protein n=1 Tax=Penicillium nucicola TaxID=1850975 RepID=UPI002544FE47|nr:uncharacterized protein N7511_004584 [Penicillium nucicola]KAJ5766968.1 hypothetical protein N7511_004584 [Penicillium nucicola]
MIPSNANSVKPPRPKTCPTPLIAHGMIEELFEGKTPNQKPQLALYITIAAPVTGTNTHVFMPGPGLKYQTRAKMRAMTRILPKQNCTSVSFTLPKKNATTSNLQVTHSSTFTVITPRQSQAPALVQQ